MRAFYCCERSCPTKHFSNGDRTHHHKTLFSYLAETSAKDFPVKIRDDLESVHAYAVDHDMRRTRPSRHDLNHSHDHEIKILEPEVEERKAAQRAKRWAKQVSKFACTVAKAAGQAMSCVAQEAQETMSAVASKVLRPKRWIADTGSGLSLIHI